MPHIRFSDAVEQALLECAQANSRTLFLFAGVAAESDALYSVLKREAGASRVRVVNGGGATALGVALGAAAGGTRTILNLDDASILADGLGILSQQGGAGHFLSQGQQTLPLLLRFSAGARSGLVPLEGWLAHDPGLYVAVPSTPYDAKGILRSALREESAPVLFAQTPDLAGVEGEVPDADYTLPFGSASVRRRGRDLTVVAYGALANTALTACERAATEEGIDVELIDLRSLRPLDVRSVLESLSRTGRLLLCSEGPRTGNFLNELAQQANEHAFDDLDAPVRRICGADAPIPASAALAAEAAPGVERILQAIRDLARE
jgi:pyruvate/2-oxoglutarate/acetoin dehydrogenase E1 component